MSDIRTDHHDYREIFRLDDSPSDMVALLVNTSVLTIACAIVFALAVIAHSVLHLL